MFDEKKRLEELELKLAESKAKEKKLVAEMKAERKELSRTVKAQVNEDKRKMRNTTLVNLGIMIEDQYKTAPSEVREWLDSAAQNQTNERVKEACLYGLSLYKKALNPVQS